MKSGLLCRKTNKATKKNIFSSLVGNRSRYVTALHYPAKMKAGFSCLWGPTIGSKPLGSCVLTISFFGNSIIVKLKGNKIFISKDFIEV